MADPEVEDALAHSFLARLPPEVCDALRAEGERADYPAGTTAYRAGSDRLAARVSQQELADAAGSVREVVARVLRDLRLAGIVATTTDSVVILDPARLYAESGGATGL